MNGRICALTVSTTFLSRQAMQRAHTQTRCSCVGKVRKADEQAVAAGLK